MSIKNEFEGFANLIKQGKTLEAIDRYFDDNVIQRENGTTIEGKLKLRHDEEIKLGRVTSLGIEVRDVVIEEVRQMVWGEMSLTFNSKTAGLLKLNEAFYQKWKDGKVLEQRFYYKQVEKG